MKKILGRGDSLTQQMKEWSGQFGEKYTRRNCRTLNELNRMYFENYGITAAKLNDMFFGKMNRDIRILEVGTNVGNRLLLLQKMGFKNLYGIEINSYALKLAKSRTNGINIIQGSALDIPFKDNYFGLVFTSGLLIHIHPRDVKKVVFEIHRCSSRYIWGYEYYSKKYEQISYRGEKGLMWRANFPKIYADCFPNLELLKVKYLKYLKDNNVDSMFLLKKQ